MALFVMLTKLTDAGRQTVMKNPGRIWEVNKEVADMGAKVLQQYVTMGPYDFINIIEAPSNEVMARVALQLGARGTLEPMTMSAISIDNFIKEINMAKAIKE